MADERAVFAGWTPKEKLYHLKIHLDKIALDVFRMLPDAARDSFEHAVEALRKCFKSMT